MAGATIQPVTRSTNKVLSNYIIMLYVNAIRQLKIWHRVE